MKDMASEEVEGVFYGGWLPVNEEPNNPSFTLVDKPSTTELLTQGSDFSYFEPQQGVVNWASMKPWQKNNIILDRQQEGGFFPPLQLNPPDKIPLESNFILERQQVGLGGFFPPLQLNPRDIALGGIVLSLLVTAVIGWMH